MYLVWDGTKLAKLFTSFDTVGSYVAQWARLPVEVAPDDYITRIGGNNWASLARLKAGAWTVVAVSGQNNLGWVQDGYGGSDGYLFFFADINGKTSLFRNNGTSNEVLATYANWRDLSLLTATGGDSAIAYGTLAGPVPTVVRFSGTSSSPVMGPGLAIDGASAAGIGEGSIPKGINSSGALLRTFGDSLLRASAAGVSTLLKPGDPLPGGALASLGAIAGNRQGDIAFSAQHGSKMALYTYRGGQVQMVADTDDPLGGSGATVYGFPAADSQIAMNNSGHVAAVVYNSGGNGIFLLSGPASGASAKTVVRDGNIVPGTATTFNGVNQIAIDDNDRVAFIANTSGGKTGLFLWEGGSLREILETGQNDPNGRSYQGLYSVQAAGARFYLRVFVAGLNEVIVTDGATVKVLAYDGYITTFGTVMSSCFGSELAANSRGDVVLPALTPSGPMLLVRRADGLDVQVAAATTRGPDGEWFLNLYGAGIGEQGELIFGAQSWVDGRIRVALYQALASP